MQTIKQVLQSFNRPVKVCGCLNAPQCWRVQVKPLRRMLKNGNAGQMTRVVHLRNLADDIALALGAQSVNVVRDAEGLWLEIAKSRTETVKLESVWKPQEGLGLVLGRAVSGRLTTVNLSDPNSCHLLVAGQSGSGKTVLLQTILYNLMAAQTLLRVTIIDTKHELEAFNGSPMLSIPVVTDPRHAVRVLQYILKVARQRHKNNHNPFPVVIVIDEYADLRLTEPAVEQVIVGLAQLGRSADVHLVLATQRPSVDVVSGSIKANFPARIALTLPSRVDSQTVLDRNGAERLLGRGDALLLIGGKVTRFQVAV